MKYSVPIGEFKTHCYHLLDLAQKENKPFIITKRGHPIAKIFPLEENPPKTSLFGMMQDKASLNGDLLDPANVTWDAESD